MRPDPPHRPSTGWRHRAWIVAAVTLGALVAGSSFRSSTGVLMEPLEAEYGWSRTVTSGAVTVNLLLYGLTAPFAAAIMERFGVRRVVTAALVCVGLGSALTTVMTAAWQLWLLWGLFIGAGTGCMALVFGAIVANRWFDTHRGLVTGLFSAANALGQLAFLPLIAAAVTGPGWRFAAGVVAVLALVLAPLVYFLLHDHPHEVGTTPYGASPPDPASDAASDPASDSADVSLDALGVTTDLPAVPQADPSPGPAALALRTLREASGSWAFWVLAGTFFVCGWSTNGLIQTHFVPAAHDHGMPATTAAGLLAVVGLFDVVGTVASGWLSDRVDARLLLWAYYGLRGLSLIALPWLWAPDVQPGMWAFIIFYGLDWVATVPPTVALCRQHFGLERSGIVFGWVFAAHMVGAGAGASVAGWIRQSQGDYRLAWWAAGLLCAAAAASVFTIRRPEVPAAQRDRVPEPV
ncbi:MAG: MFS transporter [Actinobacteria bacterium]|nr:MFS transporter [Actinomycetota bacterium]